MTKEEIQKNSEHWYNKYKNAEKRIVELETENNNLLDVINNQDVKIADLEQKLEQTKKDLADYQFNYPSIKELEKENAELKKWQKDTIKARGNDYMDWSRMKDQLTKAKDLLTKWVELFKPKGGNIPPTPIQVDTEQFLKGENIILEDALVGNSPFDADEVFNKEMKAYTDEKVK